MKFYYCIGSLLMVCITGVCMAQKTVVVSTQRTNTLKASFNQSETDYTKLQEELKQLEQQKQKLLVLMNDFNEQQKKIMSRMEKVEKTYDSISTNNNTPVQLLKATRQMQETQMSFNLQYLQLQNQMQHENRSYTALSNIMKTKHDTVKNSISNIR